MGHVVELQCQVEQSEWDRGQAFHRKAARHKISGNRSFVIIFLGAADLFLEAFGKQKKIGSYNSDSEDYNDLTEPSWSLLILYEVRTRYEPRTWLSKAL